ncbi:MAG: LysM peptidoglycan-binding domain-containing protein, partial [Firmicutes bacterium]|nr:LysM peptidoglycan-binding domain-containing protein [Bacillota bacterium]
PQSNPHLIPTVEHVEHRLIPILGDPEGASFAAEQTSILDLFIKVTDTVQREVVTSVLYVPPSEDPCTPEHAETIIYVVKKGDTLWKIAKHFGTTIDKILKDNPWIENPSLIYPGQKITIHKCVP